METSVKDYSVTNIFCLIVSHIPLTEEEERRIGAIEEVEACLIVGAEMADSEATSGGWRERWRRVRWRLRGGIREKDQWMEERNGVKVGCKIH